MERDQQQIKADIERGRDQLASAVDQLVYRLDPKRLATQAQDSAKARLNTPAGKAAVGGTVALLTLVIIRNLRKSRR